jgi:hypothetical protein
LRNGGTDTGVREFLRDGGDQIAPTLPVIGSTMPVT